MRACVRCVSPDVLEGGHDVTAEGVGALRDAGEYQPPQVLSVARQEFVERLLRQVVAEVQVQGDQVLHVAPLRPRPQDLKEGGRREGVKRDDSVGREGEWRQAEKRRREGETVGREGLQLREGEWRKIEEREEEGREEQME